MDDHKDRFDGCLLGLAVGDIMGCPVEGFHPDQIREEYGRVESLVEPRRKGEVLAFRWRLPGLHSDDTQQAMTLADVIAEHGRVVPEALLATWREMAACDITFISDVDGAQVSNASVCGCHRGFSRRFRQTVQGTEGEPGEAMCDGAAMRVAPVGLLRGIRPGDRVVEAARSALVTHRHPHAVASAVAMAAAVAYVASQAEPDPEEMLREVAWETTVGERMAAEVARYDPELKPRVLEFSRVVRQLPQLLNKGELAFDWIACHGRLTLGAEPDEPVFATKSWAILAVPTALLLAARHLDSFKDGIIDAINRGGDADTIGAMVGAIIGAARGRSGIPEEWLSHLLAREQVRARAEWLATGIRPAVWRPQHTFETALTRREARERQKLQHDSKQRRKTMNRYLAIVDKDHQLRTPEALEAHEQLMRLLSNAHECRCYPDKIHNDYVVWFSGGNTRRHQYCRQCRGYDSEDMGR